MDIDPGVPQAVGYMVSRGQRPRSSLCASRNSLAAGEILSATAEILSARKGRNKTGNISRA
ncbi:MAG: hypothetical protein J6R92_08180, partial [Akkermansia sp.]|nr:hypothetical protein [Akkermansia sp.]